MKKSLHIISRAALAVAAAGALSLSSSVFAQEGSTTAGTDPSSAASTTPPPGATPTPTLSSMAGVGQKPRVNKDKDKAMPTANKNAPDGKTDQQFLTTAAKGNMMEIHMGQMAQKEGKSDEVKKLGGQIAADHASANKELMAIAQKRGLQLDTRHKMDKMSQKDMANFDQAWLTGMMRDHDKDIALYEQEAKMGTDPEAKAYAKKTLPVLKKHQKMVKDAQGKMMKKS